MRKRAAERVLLIGTLLAGLAPLSGARAQPAQKLVPIAALDKRAVTVSGFSSGAFFAHQFHIAFSGLVNGAGLVAGGPYGCAEQVPTPMLARNPFAAEIMATKVCTHVARLPADDWWLPEGPSATPAEEAVRREARNGGIDDPRNLADDRVWLLRGGQDSVVPAASMGALIALYQHLGVTGDRLANPKLPQADHGLPIAEPPAESRFHPIPSCSMHAPPYLVVGCNLDAAGDLLRHLYPEGFGGPAKADPARLARFGQGEFLAPDAGLDAVGHLYVPAACARGEPGSCRLHVAFHGCLQYEGNIGDDFFWDGGYNRWAEANRIVVLYPQTVPIGANPSGCWDWWGYSGPDFQRRSGQQMRAVRAMVGRLLGE